MGDIWNALIVQPFAWLLGVLYSFTGSYALAIVLFALVTKLVLLYFSARGKKGMMKTQRIQPKVQELEKKYGTDKQKYQLAVQQLYKDENVSMTGGCLWTLLPFPIMIALYGVIRAPFTHIMGLAADQVNRISDFLANAGVTVPEAASYYRELQLSNLLHGHFTQAQQAIPEFGAKLVDINYNFLGLNLAEIPTLAFTLMLIIPFMSGATSYLSMWVSQKVSGMPKQQGMGRTMSLLMPLVSVWISFSLPALMGLYWTAQNVFTMVQDYFLTKHYKKVFEKEDAERAALEARRKAAEEAMKEEQRQRRAAQIAEKKKKRKPGQTVYKVKNKPQGTPENTSETSGEDPA